MFFLVDKQTRKVLAKGDNSNSIVTGEWAEWIKEGRALWVPSIPGFEYDEVTVSDDGSLSGDLSKKAAKQAAATDYAAKAILISEARSRVSSYNDDTASGAESKQNRKDTALLLKHLLGG